MPFVQCKLPSESPRWAAAHYSVFVILALQRLPDFGAITSGEFKMRVAGYDGWPTPFRQGAAYGYNLISKVHDFTNSWDYDSNTGFRIEGGPWAGASAASAARFEVFMNAYSFAMMPPAALYALGTNTSQYMLPYHVRH